jgi:Fic family protein
MTEMATKKQSGFSPRFTITPMIVQGLMRIEAVKHAIDALPVTPRVLANLRKTARLFSTHYSTMIEGNMLTQEQVAQVINEDQHFPGRERDHAEVRGYYAALDEAEELARDRVELTEAALRRLHALVMGSGKTRIKPTPYRDGQNVIKDSGRQGIVYMPPEAADVPLLMKDLVAWIVAKDDLPVPLKAAVAHYQFATVHPYYDGNGRTARLLTTFILHWGGYGLKGLYALEEYYARDLSAYSRRSPLAHHTTTIWGAQRLISLNGLRTSSRAWQSRLRKFETRQCAKRVGEAAINLVSFVISTRNRGRR